MKGIHVRLGPAGFALLALLLACGSTRAEVCGYVTLQGKDCHYATRVTMDGLLDRECWTDQFGRYCFSAVAPGWHTFHYRHAGFESESQDCWVKVLGDTRVPDVALETKATCNPASWQDYPYTIPGTDLTFPRADGIHNPYLQVPVEWWYGNFHVTSTSGKRYAVWVAFFKLPHMVLMSVTDLDTGVTYSGDRYPMTFSASEDHLDISASLPPFTDRWYNEICGDYLHAFEYWLDMNWIDSGVVDLYLQTRPVKPPIAVGGDGYIEIGDDWTYYTCQPRMDVAGVIHVPGGPLLGEDVTGYGWMDHQWAGFPTQKTSWEWLSIQLDDRREIMVADLWIDGVEQGSFSGGLNYYRNNCAMEVLTNYEMTSLETWTDPVSGREWAVKWRVQEPSRGIDLIVNRRFNDQVMRLGIFDLLPACFWEGPCTVSGTIGGQPVSGTAFAEVTHAQSGSVGSCCLGVEGCILMTEAECAAQGGQFSGLGSHCNSVTAVCCIEDHCEMLSACDCGAEGGDWYEGYVSCDPIDCEALADAEEPTGITETALLPPVPNPGLASVLLRCNLAVPALLRVEIFDVGGRAVRLIHDGPSPASQNVFSWNGTDDSGKRVSPGTYFCRMTTGTGQITRSLVLLQR